VCPWVGIYHEIHQLLFSWPYLRLHAPILIHRHHLPDRLSTLQEELCGGWCHWVTLVRHTVSLWAIAPSFNQVQLGLFFFLAMIDGEGRKTPVLCSVRAK